MNKIVIIGASYLQLPLILKAKNMGFETHVFAWEEGAVGKTYADFFYPISIREKDEILHRVRNIKPDGVISIASDLASITVNYIAQNLGLIGNSTECTDKTTNKAAMRKILSENELPCPRFMHSSSMDEVLRHFDLFPLIVKPTDRSGSRGVTKVDNYDGLSKAIERAKMDSFAHEVIIEDYIYGQEISVEAISWKGAHQIIQYTLKETTGEPYFVETGQHQPYHMSETLKKEIERIVIRALSVLGIEYGASHSELIIKANEEVFITEIGARMGGDFIGSHLVELSTGYDFLRNSISVACGKKPEQFTKNLNLYSGIYYLIHKPGLVINIENYSEQNQHVLLANIDCSIGQQISEIKQSADRVAWYMYQADRKLKFDPNIIRIDVM